MLLSLGWPPSHTVDYHLHLIAILPQIGAFCPLLLAICIIWLIVFIAHIALAGRQTVCPIRDLEGIKSKGIINGQVLVSFYF